MRWGSEVGYAVRFDDFTNAATRLKYMTDGILLQVPRWLNLGHSPMHLLPLAPNPSPGLAIFC